MVSQGLGGREGKGRKAREIVTAGVLFPSQLQKTEALRDPGGMGQSARKDFLAEIWCIIGFFFCCTYGLWDLIFLARD